MNTWYEIKNNKLLRIDQKTGRGGKKFSKFQTYIGNLKDEATKNYLKQVEGQGFEVKKG